jgi:hypothetical protein
MIFALTGRIRQKLKEKHNVSPWKWCNALAIELAGFLKIPERNTARANPMVYCGNG